MEEIAVVGLTLAPQGIVSIGAGVLIITSTPSSKNKAGGQFVYEAPLTFTLIGANATGYDPATVATVGSGSIPATATKVRKKSGPLIMRENDEDLVVNMTGLIGGTPTPFTEPWKITNAGQSKVGAN